jgi:hypothetical protein
MTLVIINPFQGYPGDHVRWYPLPAGWDALPEPEFFIRLQVRHDELQLIRVYVAGPARD